jgi:hypothetical protein
MILIASSFSLLVIVAGMFLLAKTQKDNLSSFFKYVSYFVILVGFLNFFGGGACMLAHMCMKHCAAQCKEHCEKGHGKHGHMKDDMMMEKRMMMMHGHGDCCMGEEKCMGMEQGCPEAGMKHEGACCKDKMMMMKKDTVIIKK